MSIAALVRAMSEAGATPQVIAIAVEAVEAAKAEIDNVRTKAREKKRAQREAAKASCPKTVPGPSRDASGTNRDNTPSPSPSPSFPPHPPNNPTPAPTHENNTTRARGTRLETAWICPEDWLIWAESERDWARSEVEAEAASFHDHWIAKPGRDGVKLDWQATWRNWVRNSRRNGGNARQPGQPRNGQRLGPTASAALELDWDAIASAGAARAGFR